MEKEAVNEEKRFLELNVLKGNNNEQVIYTSGPDVPIGLEDSVDLSALEISSGRNEYGKLKIFAPQHAKKLKSFQQGTVTAPPYVRIKPTNVCNHACDWGTANCTYADRRDGGTSASKMHTTTDVREIMPREKMMEILDDFRDMGVRAVTYSGGGEPTLFPHMQETLERTLKYGIQLSIITHGQFLMQPRVALLRHAKWVRVSQDATDEETYQDVRGKKAGTLEALKRGLKEFIRVKDQDCKVEINFIVGDKNYNHVYQGAKMWREVGVDNISFSPAWLDDPPFEEYHAPFKQQVLDQIARAREEFDEGRGGFRVLDSYSMDIRFSSERRYGRCFIMQTVPAIGADQAVYFCHNKAYDNTGMLGSIKNRSFKDLWFSPEAAETFRKFNARECCQHECAADTKNMAVNLALTDPKVLSGYTSEASHYDSAGINFV